MTFPTADIIQCRM